MNVALYCLREIGTNKFLNWQWEDKYDRYVWYESSYPLRLAPFNLVNDMKSACNFKCEIVGVEYNLVELNNDNPCANQTNTSS